jgi:hypothetical protein
VKSGRSTMVEKIVQSFENNDLQNLNMKEISYGLNYDGLLDLDNEEEKSNTLNTNTLQNNEQNFNNSSTTNNNIIISESSDSESEEEFPLIPPLQLQMTSLRDLATIEIPRDNDDFSLHLNLENILLYVSFFFFNTLLHITIISK